MLFIIKPILYYLYGCSYFLVLIQHVSRGCWEKGRGNNHIKIKGKAEIGFISQQPIQNGY